MNITPHPNKKRKKITIADIKAAKHTEKPLVCLTAYTTPMAKIIDPYCDLILVGDSLGMVLYGMDNTCDVTMDMMINHGKAVMRANPNACIVVDLPYGSYENSREQALESAKRVIQETKCDAVKLEGGQDMEDTIAHLVNHNIPVMAHIGLQPQSVEKEGGYKIKGKTEASEKHLLMDAEAITRAGAFSVVIEGTIESVSQKITQNIDIPTIGIGASVTCDGQILVTDDMLGMLRGHTPKFVKKYAQIADHIEKAAAQYTEEVQNRTFPNNDYIYTKK